MGHHAAPEGDGDSGVGKNFGHASAADFVGSVDGGGGAADDDDGNSPFHSAPGCARVANGVERGVAVPSAVGQTAVPSLADARTANGFGMDVVREISGLGMFPIGHVASYFDDQSAGMNGVHDTFGEDISCMSVDELAAPDRLDVLGRLMLF